MDKNLLTYYSNWEIKQEYIFAYELWIKYQYQCEMYDKTVCSREILDNQGFVKPTSGEEMQLINKNALCFIDDLLFKAKELKICKETLNNAKKEVERLTWKGVQEEYKRIFKEM